MDPINTEYSHEHLRRIVETFRSSGLKTDIYLSTGLAQNILEAPDNTELLDLLRSAVKEGHGVGMLTLTSHPLISEAGKDLEWDDLYQLSKLYATTYQDPITGEFDDTRPGGSEVFRDIFGRSPDIITRNVVTDVYYHRQRGAVLSLGGFPSDWLDGWVAPPLAWFMGMVTLLHYPLAQQSWDYIFWPPEPLHAKQLLDKIVESLPGPGPHVLFIGGHNVDFYANNPCWTAKDLGWPRHVEMWAYLDRNPSSLELAKIPEPYFLSDELVERNYELLRLVLKTFQNRAESDQNFEIVTARQLVERIDTSMEKVLDREQIIYAARFLVENTRRGPPEWVPLEDGDFLTLAQAYGALTSALSAFQENDAIPGHVITNNNLLGPTTRPVEWVTTNRSPRIKGEKLRISELSDCCAGIAQKFSEREPPDIPVYAIVDEMEINAAEMLFAMAQAIINIENVREKHVTLRKLTLHPDPCIYARQSGWLSDNDMKNRTITEQLNRLQLWTVKPIKFK